MKIEQKGSLINNTQRTIILFTIRRHLQLPFDPTGETPYRNSTWGNCEFHTRTLKLSTNCRTGLTILFMADYELLTLSPISFFLLVPFGHQFSHNESRSCCRSSLLRIKWKKTLYRYIYSRESWPIHSWGQHMIENVFERVFEKPIEGFPKRGKYLFDHWTKIITHYMWQSFPDLFLAGMVDDL